MYGKMLFRDDIDDPQGFYWMDTKFHAKSHDNFSVHNIDDDDGQ